jgi:hypothetical protein
MDTLTGSAGVDWLFYNKDTGVKDKATDSQSNEFQTDID